VLLAGDAASLINPLTGEGIFYAVLSGALAGAAAAHGAGRARPTGGAAPAAGRGTCARRRRLAAEPLAAADGRRFRAAAADQRVFDDVVDLGLADGRLTARTLAAKAPMRGDLLVLDESHWVADPDRGHHWARLVLTGEYREMHLISAAEAYLLLKPLVADAKKITVVNHKRLSRLDVLRAPVRPTACARRRSSSPSPARPSTPSPRSSTSTGPARSASSTARCRRPPAARSSSGSPRGELEVLVTTDVIGHGINVPATTVLFAETTKFDGSSGGRCAPGRPPRSPAGPAATASPGTARSASSPG
jgi:hypothetical protein